MHFCNAAHAAGSFHDPYAGTLKGANAAEIHQGAICIIELGNCYLGTRGVDGRIVSHIVAPATDNNGIQRVGRYGGMGIVASVVILEIDHERVFRAGFLRHDIIAHGAAGAEGHIIR